MGSIPKSGNRSAAAFHPHLCAWHPLRGGEGKAAVVPVCMPLHTQGPRPATNRSLAIPSPPTISWVATLTKKSGETEAQSGWLQARSGSSPRSCKCASRNVVSGNHGPVPPARGGKRSQARRRHLSALSEAKIGEVGKGRKKKHDPRLLFGMHAFTELSAGVYTRTACMRLGERLSGQQSRGGMELNEVCFCTSDLGSW